MGQVGKFLVVLVFAHGFEEILREEVVAVEEGFFPFEAVNFVTEALQSLHFTGIRIYIASSTESIV